MTSLAHERLDVYGAAIEFLLVADQVAGALPRGRSYLRLQESGAGSGAGADPGEK